MPYEKFMKEALSLARKGLGRTSPNPVVGSVVVKGGRVIAGGWHKKAGGAHAEIEALRAAGSKARGSNLVVTLEPCCHFGKTPPCVEAIIAAGIRKVIVGAPDPNPLVSGKGVAALRAAGIGVTEGVLSAECAALNEGWNKFITTGYPFVTLKLAASLDGRIAASGGDSKWITGVQSRRLVHGMRAQNDAVMVGGLTALKDDPELTVRLVSGRDPVKVVLDSTLRVPVASKIFNNAESGRLIIFASKNADEKRAAKARAAGAEVVTLAEAAGGLPLKKVLKELAKRGIASVLVEGGGVLASSLLRERLVDELVLFYGPLVIGADGLPMVAPLGLKGLKDAPGFKIVAVKKAGPDIIIKGRPI